MMRVGNIIFLRLIKVAVGLWGILSTTMSSSQKTPKRHITIINWEPKVSGKLLCLTIARFVPWMTIAPP